MPGLLGVSLLSCVHFGALLEPTSNRFFKTFDKLRFRALHPQLRHWQVRSNRDSVWGRRAGSHIIRLPRLLGEGPMGKPVAHPQRKGRPPANGSIGPSANPQDKVAKSIGER